MGRKGVRPEHRGRASYSEIPAEKVARIWAEERSKEGRQVAWQRLLPQRGFEVLPRRWVVEHTFSWLGQNRRTSKDYERLKEDAKPELRAKLAELEKTRKRRPSRAGSTRWAPRADKGVKRDRDASLDLLAKVAPNAVEALAPEGRL